MALSGEVLSKEEQEVLDDQLSTVFNTVLSVSDELKAAKQQGDDAKQKAEEVKSDVFHRKQAIETLKDATIINAEGNISTLEVVEKLSENQQKLINACREFAKLGMVDLASNRAVVKYISDAISDGAEHSLNEETVEQLKGVIRDLKQKEDLLVKQKKQGDKINQHEKRIGEIESRTDELDDKIRDRSDYDKKQDEAINRLDKKNQEQDERLIAGDKYDEFQDARLEKGEQKDIEQDRLLDYQKKTDERHDRELASLGGRIDNLEKRLDSMEQDLILLKENRRIRLFIGISCSIGTVGVILGIISLII